VVTSPISLFASRKWVHKNVYRNIAKMMSFCLRRIVNIDFEIRNIERIKEAIGDSHFIIGCNHQSSWETLIFADIFDDFVIVVKKGLLHIPFASLCLRRLHSIPVDRKSPVSSIRSLLKYGKIANENKESILIFPSGTRSSIDERAEYKSGVFALYKSTGMPVVPVHMNSGAYWPRRSFKKTSGTIILTFKHPILPGMNKDKFFEEFEKRIDEN
jgi:1-acyl-sn-glycerol-3-phosphate acyltransferase